MNPALLAPTTLTLCTDADATSDALRDDLADARRERDLWKFLYRAAMDGLALWAHAPERAEQIQRALLKERETFMAAEFRRRVGV